MTANRKTLRAHLKTLLEAELNAAQTVTVYGYGKRRFKGQSPVVCVTSAGSERPRLTFAGSQLTASFDVHTFVVHSKDADGWTEANAEDLLDDLEQQIAAACDKNPARVRSWGLLRYSGPTDAREIVKLEGVDYLHEVISVEMQE